MKTPKPKGKYWQEMICSCGQHIGWTRYPVVYAYCEDCTRREMAWRNGWKKEAVNNEITHRH